MTQVKLLVHSYKHNTYVLTYRTCSSPARLLGTVTMQSITFDWSSLAHLLGLTHTHSNGL